MTPAPGRRIPPAGLLLFLGYAFVILGVIGISLRWVVDQAIGAAVSLPGIVTMVLLAYTIFTITMVLQRKQAARGWPRAWPLSRSRRCPSSCWGQSQPWRSCRPGSESSSSLASAGLR